MASGNYLKVFSSKVMHLKCKDFKNFQVSLTNHGLGQLRLRLEAREVKKHCNSKPGRITKVCKDMMTNTTKLLKPPFLKQSALICGLMFCMGFASFSFSSWFPELIRRLENFEDMFPGESSWICSSFPGTIAANETVQFFLITHDFSCFFRRYSMYFLFNSKDDALECPVKMPTEAYMHTLIIYAASLPSTILVVIGVDKLGYNFFIGISLQTTIKTAMTLQFRSFFIKVVTILTY